MGMERAPGMGHTIPRNERVQESGEKAAQVVADFTKKFSALFASAKEAGSSAFIYTAGNVIEGAKTAASAPGRAWESIKNMKERFINRITTAANQLNEKTNAGRAARTRRIGELDKRAAAIGIKLTMVPMEKMKEWWNSSRPAEKLDQQANEAEGDAMSHERDARIEETLANSEAAVARRKIYEAREQIREALQRIQDLEEDIVATYEIRGDNASIRRGWSKQHMDRAETLRLQADVTRARGKQTYSRYRELVGSLQAAA